MREGGGGVAVLSSSPRLGSAVRASPGDVYMLFGVRFRGEKELKAVAI